MPSTEGDNRQHNAKSQNAKKSDASKHASKEEKEEVKNEEGNVVPKFADTEKIPYKRVGDGESDNKPPPSSEEEKEDGSEKQSEKSEADEEEHGEENHPDVSNWQEKAKAIPPVVNEKGEFQNHVGELLWNASEKDPLVRTMYADPDSPPPPPLPNGPEKTIDEIVHEQKEKEAKPTFAQKFGKKLIDEVETTTDKMKHAVEEMAPSKHKTDEETNKETKEKSPESPAHPTKTVGEEEPPSDHSEEKKSKKSKHKKKSHHVTKHDHKKKKSDDETSTESDGTNEDEEESEDSKKLKHSSKNGKEVEKESKGKSSHKKDNKDRPLPVFKNIDNFDVESGGNKKQKKDTKSPRKESDSAEIPDDLGSRSKPLDSVENLEDFKEKPSTSADHHGHEESENEDEDLKNEEEQRKKSIQPQDDSGNVDEPDKNSRNGHRKVEEKIEHEEVTQERDGEEHKKMSRKKIEKKTSQQEKRKATEKDKDSEQEVEHFQEQDQKEDKESVKKQDKEQIQGKDKKQDKKPVKEQNKEQIQGEGKKHDKEIVKEQDKEQIQGEDKKQHKKQDKELVKEQDKEQIQGEDKKQRNLKQDKKLVKEQNKEQIQGEDKKHDKELVKEQDKVQDKVQDKEQAKEKDKEEPATKKLVSRQPSWPVEPQNPTDEGDKDVLEEKILLQKLKEKIHHATHIFHHDHAAREKEDEEPSRVLITKDPSTGHMVMKPIDDHSDSISSGNHRHSKEFHQSLSNQDSTHHSKLQPETEEHERELARVPMIPVPGHMTITMNIPVLMAQTRMSPPTPPSSPNALNNQQPVLTHSSNRGKEFHEHRHHNIPLMQPDKDRGHR